MEPDDASTGLLALALRATIPHEPGLGEHLKTGESWAGKNRPRGLAVTHSPLDEAPRVDRLVEAVIG